MFTGVSSGGGEAPFFGGNMQKRKNVASVVSGSHFATMRERMPMIKTKAEDDEKPTETS